MGRKPVANPAEQISISLTQSLVARLDRIPGSRSSNIQKSLNETLPKDYDRSIMEYFFNALHGQMTQESIMPALKKAEIESHLRNCWKIPSTRNIWDIVPPEVRDWCHAFVIPLEDELCNLSKEEREIFITIATRRLHALIETN